jgi:flagellar biogenesis protein FliO
MFETLFGAEMPLALRFFIAFVVVLALIGATAFVVRRFGGDRMGAAASRGRQPRLAVVDAASVDGRRRLILIRRDNVEHLLMIGGPTDVVVELNIVRAAASRDTAPARSPAGPELLPRTVTIGEGSQWPLQPEPALPTPSIGLSRPQRSSGQDEPAPWPAENESPMPPPRPARAADPLAGLAFELARGPAQPETTAPSPPPRPSRPPLPERAPRERQRLEPRAELRPEPIPDLQPTTPAEPPFGSAAEQNLAEMAHRLEAALRKPTRAKEPRTPEPTPPPPPEISAAPETPEPPPVPGEPNSAATEQKPAAPKSVYDSLEQEMASLLGRPPDKP